MNRRSEILVGGLAALGLGLLIFDSKTALVAARDGIQLCVYTLVPTLLPFFFLSNLLTGVLMGREIKLLQPLGVLCRIPKGAEYILVAGFLGGYPLGAQCISQACESGSLSNRDGRRMLAFCNNCGPAFLFGVAGTLFQDSNVPWILFTIHLISAFIVGVILPGEPSRCMPRKSKSPSAVQALWQSIKGLASVCGWVVLFRVLLSILDRWLLWYLPPILCATIHGIFELANGCINLSTITDPQIRFVLCSAVLSFGGLCVMMQTHSVASKVDRNLYFPGKVLQTCISLTLACLLSVPKWAIYPGAVAFLIGFFLRARENKCRNPQKLVV